MAVRLAVDPNEDLDQLIEDIKAQPSKEVVLSLPQETRALQTLDNFYALRNMVRTAGVNLSITGGSKQTRGLAKLLGFAVDKEAGAGDDDGGAGEIFGNAPTMAPNQPSANGGGGGLRNTTPFGMPDGFVVSGSQNGSAPPPAPAPAQPPPVQPRNAQDFFNEMRDFNPGLPNTPLQPPPANPNRSDFNGNPFGSGDQVLTRENIPDFFEAGGTGAPRQAPPPPRPEFDLEGGRTMSFEEATRSGLFGGSGPGLGTFEPGPGLDEVGLGDDEIPAVPAGGDNAADRFRRPRGVRNPDEVEAGGRTGRRLPTIGRRGPRRDNRAAAAAASGTVASNSGVLNRVRRILVPVEPKAANSGLMSKPSQSPEEIKRREDQRRRTTLMTLLGVLLVLLIVGFVVWLLLGSAKGGDIFSQPPVAVTVPLKTQVQDQTVRLQLVPGGTTSGVPGVNQATSTTPGATVAPTAGAPITTTPDAGSASPGVGGTPGATATVSTGPAQLPVNLINTGDIKVSDQANATGIRQIPDKAASAPVTFINRGASAKGYSAGAIIYSANGINYRLVDGITIGAGNLSTGAGGSAKGTVVADKAGTPGNFDGTRSRVLGDTVLATIGPATGGTTGRQEKFVTQADQDNLMKQLQDKAKNQANGQVKYDPATEAVLPIKATNPTCDFSKKVNDAADNFTGNCTMSLQAAVYNTKTLADQIKTAYNSNPSFKLDDTTPVKLLDTQIEQSGNQIFMNIKASGRVIPTLDVSAFQSDIANKSKAELSTLIQTKYANVIDLGMMNLDSISKDPLPAANQIQVKAVPDTQMSTDNGTLTPSATSSTTGGSLTVSPSPAK